jgi:LDH2 family malate/lactate/ureidoglycolate dehydrogenase
VRPDEALERLLALGLSAEDAETLREHFLDAEHRGKLGHGLARIAWLETQEFDAGARPERVEVAPGFERWDGNGALGYLTLAAICASLVERPPSRVTVVCAERCFPTGMLGYWVRRLAEAGLVALLTATSPPRLPHPEGGEALVGTNPLAVGLPNESGPPIVVDVSMGRVTHGDVLRGAARHEELVPFGGEQAHKAFALAVGLEGLVESLVGEEQGALLLVAPPRYEGFARRLRDRAAGLRLPGDR